MTNKKKGKVYARDIILLTTFQFLQKEERRDNACWKQQMQERNSVWNGWTIKKRRRLGLLFTDSLLESSIQLLVVRVHVTLTEEQESLLVWLRTELIHTLEQTTPSSSFKGIFHSHMNNIQRENQWKRTSWQNYYCLVMTNSIWIYKKLLWLLSIQKTTLLFLINRLTAQQQLLL